MRVFGALVDVRPLREHPAYRRLWLGTTASGFGSQLGTFAVVFYIWDRTRSPAVVGLIGLFTAAPLIGFALLGSAFADQVDRRRLVIATTWGQIVTSLLMAVAVAASADHVWAVLVLAGVASGLGALAAPAQRAAVPGLLPADRLAAGLALNHLSFQLAMLLGPALAGVVTARWGVATCLLVDAVTFGAGLAGVSRLPARRPARGAGRPGAGAIRAGLRFAARTPAPRGAFLADLCATVLAMPIALFPAVNQARFGGSAQVLGLFFSALAAGGVLASGLSGLVSRREHPGRVLLAAGAVWGASLAVVGLSDRLAVVLVLLAVAGGADTWAVVARGTVVQSATPESHRGRVASLEHIVGAAGPQVGNFRAGLVAAATSPGAALVIGGVTCLAGLALIGRLTPQLRYGDGPDVRQGRRARTRHP